VTGKRSEEKGRQGEGRRRSERRDGVGERKKGRERRIWKGKKGESISRILLSEPWQPWTA